MGYEKTKCNNPIREAVKEWNRAGMPKIIVERVENRCVPGMPDMYMESSTGKVAWVESKWSKDLPKKVCLRNEQIIWHKQHSSIAAHSFILLRTKDKFYLWRGLYAEDIANGINMDQAKMFNVNLEERMRILSYIFV